ncbi:MAG: nitroreductase family protein [Chloroflexota bacterium]|nr:nitroreductase family protein [Chloroflexota bacterium]
MNKIVATVEDLSDTDYPMDASAAEQLSFLLNYAILAPSIYNSQPWQFDLSESYVDLYTDKTRPMPVRDPHARQMIMSCGAALFYLRIAARHFGHDVRVELFPDQGKTDLLARLRLLGPKVPTEEEEQLFEAIRTRRTNRNKYEARALPTLVVEWLGAAALAEGSLLSVVDGEEVKRNIAALVAEADHIQWSDKRFRNELAGWLRSSMGVSYDGVQAEAFGLGDFMPYTVSHVVRRLDLGSDRAAGDAELIQNSSALAILATEGDAPLDWLSAGQALARVLLRAAGAGISASFLNQPIEVDPLRARLRELCGCAAYPQVAMRVGYAPETPETPATLRRSSASVQVQL